MFRLLSKESNVFSIPVYIFFLLFVVMISNGLDFNYLDISSAIVTFIGISLGYFCFNTISLNYQSHLPLFLYTFFVFAFYPGSLDIGIAVSLLTNSFLLLILTNPDADLRKKSYLLVGSILALNYIFLPTTWALSIFVIINIIATSGKIMLNIFRLFLGIILIAISYFSFTYFLDFRGWNPDYFPFGKFRAITDYSVLYPLIPIAFLIILSIFDHFKNFNKKSPISKFKYAFLLLFTLAQVVTIILYMNKNYEYLLLLSLPIAIIVSRFLKFLPKYWMRESALWLLILSLVGYKIGGYFQIF